MSLEKLFITDESNPSYQPTINPIFFGYVIELFLDGKKTVAECRAEIEAHLSRKTETPVTLTANQVSDIGSVVTYVNGGGTDEGKALRLRRMQAILGMSQASVNWWKTREELRTEFNWIDDGA